MVVTHRPKWLPRERSLGLKADNLDLGVTFASVSDAEANAKILLSRGFRRVEIFEREKEFTPLLRA
jgi:hypothetical protein